MDLFEETYHDDKKVACPQCSGTLMLIQPPALDEHVFIYVDDSNMWIEGKKLAAKQANLKCVEDPRLRLDIGRVADVVASGREVAWGILYGSEPPPIDTVWKKIRERGWKVITSKRSRFTKKEKQVDHQMVADITTLVSDRSVSKGKIVLVSGDADVIPAVKEGLSKKWSFEIWMWRSGISTALKDLAEDNPELLTIHPLDSHLDDISFTNFKFSEKQISSKLNSRSAVIKNFHAGKDWQKKLSKKLGWPFQFCWIGPERLDNPKDYKDVLLIFASQVKSKDDKDFIYHFEKIFERLQQEYPEKVLPFPSYLKVFGKKEDICLTNNYGVLEDVDEEINMGSACDLSDEDESEWATNTADNEIAASGHLDRDERGTESNDDTADNESERVTNPSDNESAASGNLDWGTESNDGTADNESEASGNLDWGTESSDGTADNEKFQVVQKKKCKRRQQYSEQCKYRSNCKKRLNCTHGHTDAEKRFFRAPKKDKECRFKNNCTYGPRCIFAHSNKDSFCRECHQWGHLRDKCTN